MESGEPVELASSMTTMKGLVRLALVAERFGYAYADLRQAGDGGFVMSLVPDPGPEARALAAENRARYPHAGAGGALPPLVPGAADLLMARMYLDLRGRYSTGERAVLTVVGSVAASLVFGFELGGNATGALTIAGVAWASSMALLTVPLVLGRRHAVRYAARLEAAGYTPVTDRDGRLRYVPGPRA
ncbi:hypothetical protein [Streptomyces sp. R44]|uniref:Integral membrane protein n=1 Tax=Streptomyces sp. R44 TaxID=3238633 RepID=A0AB39T3H3_9ACTN